MADQIGKQALDLLLQGVGSNILPPAGDNYVLDPTFDRDESVVQGRHVSGEEPEPPVKGFPCSSCILEISHEYVPAGACHLPYTVLGILGKEKIVKPTFNISSLQA